MTDVALSILALIAGGLTVELFGTPSNSREELRVPLTVTLPEIAEEFQCGNPS